MVGAEGRLLQAPLANTAAGPNVELLLHQPVQQDPRRSPGTGSRGAGSPTGEVLATGPVTVGAGTLAPVAVDGRGRSPCAPGVAAPAGARPQTR